MSGLAKWGVLALIVSVRAFESFNSWQNDVCQPGCHDLEGYDCTNSDCENAVNQNDWLNCLESCGTCTPCGSQNLVVAMEKQVAALNATLGLQRTSEKVAMLNSSKNATNEAEVTSGPDTVEFLFDGNLDTCATFYCKSGSSNQDIHFEMAQVTNTEVVNVYVESWQTAKGVKAPRYKTILFPVDGTYAEGWLLPEKIQGWSTFPFAFLQTKEGIVRMWGLQRMQICEIEVYGTAST